MYLSQQSLFGDLNFDFEILSSGVKACNLDKVCSNLKIYDRNCSCIEDCFEHI